MGVGLSKTSARLTREHAEAEIDFVTAIPARARETDASDLRFCASPDPADCFFLNRQDDSVLHAVKYIAHIILFAHRARQRLGTVGERGSSVCYLTVAQS